MKAIRLICILLMLSAAWMCGCSKTQPQTAADVVDVTVTPWQVNTPNPLLAFVPEDAALVIASQRTRDIHSKGMLEFLDIVPDVWGSSLGTDIERLLKYYEAQAPVMGLEPNGHLDFVFYFYNGQGVMHITVADEQKANAYHQHMLKDEANLSVNHIDNWVIYSNAEWDSREENFSIATHTQNNVLTMVFSNADGKTVPDVLHPHKKHFVPKTTTGDTFVVSYMHYERMVDLLLRLPAMVREYDYRFGFWDLSEGFDSEQRDNPTAWLKANGCTSVGDDVCIREFKSMVSGISSSNLALTLSDNGAVGLRFDTALRSDILNDIQSMKTEHVVLENSDVKAGGYLSFSMDKALKLVKEIFLTKRDWKCKQAGYFVTQIIDDFDIYELFEDNNATVNYYLKDFESLAFIIKNVIVPETVEREPLQFLVHLKHSAELFKDIAENNLDIPYTDGVAHPISLNRHHQYSLLFKGRDAFFGSLVPEPDKPISRNKDAFADLTVQKSFLYSLLKDERDIPPILLQGYHLNVDVDKDSLVLSIVPIDEPIAK